MSNIGVEELKNLKLTFRLYYNIECCNVNEIYLFIYLLITHLLNFNIDIIHKYTISNTRSLSIVD